MKQERPNFEHLDRLHGEGMYIPTGTHRFEEFTATAQFYSAWPAVSAYVRELERGIIETQRRMHEAGHKSAAAMLNELRRTMGDAALGENDG